MTDLAIAAPDRAAFKSSDWGLLAGVALIWGSSFLLIALALDSYHPGVITWARVVLGAVALATHPAARVRIDPVDRPRMVLLSLVWVGLPFTLFPLAEQHINSAVTGLLSGATPIFAGIFAGLFFGRVPRGPQRIGLAVGFTGVALVGLSSAAEGGTAAGGVAMVVAATVCYGLGINLSGSLQRRYGSVAVMGRMLLLASIWTAPFGLFGLSRSRFDLGPTVAMVGLGVIGTGAAFVLMGTLIGRVGATRASFVTYLMPVVALALGVALLGDQVTPGALAGIGLIVVGAILAGRREA